MSDYDAWLLKGSDDVDWERWCDSDDARTAYDAHVAALDEEQVPCTFEEFLDGPAGQMAYETAQDEWEPDWERIHQEKDWDL